MDERVDRFDRWAPVYDLGELQPLLYHAAHRVVLERVGHFFETHGRVLDVGCGTGQLLSRARSALPAAQLVGVDPSVRMLQRAAAAMSAALVCARVERLPFLDSTFDAVTATFTYRHWTEQAAGISEVGRVLRPGGVLVMAVLLDTIRQRSVWPQRRRLVPTDLGTSLAAAAFDRIEAELVAGFGPVTAVTLITARQQCQGESSALTVTPSLRARTVPPHPRSNRALT